MLLQHVPRGAARARKTRTPSASQHAASYSHLLPDHARHVFAQPAVEVAHAVSGAGASGGGGEGGSNEWHGGERGDAGGGAHDGLVTRSDGGGAGEGEGARPGGSAGTGEGGVMADGVVGTSVIPMADGVVGTSVIPRLLEGDGGGELDGGGGGGSGSLFLPFALLARIAHKLFQLLVPAHARCVGLGPPPTERDARQR